MNVLSSTHLRLRIYLKTSMCPKENVRTFITLGLTLTSSRNSSEDLYHVLHGSENAKI